MLKFKHIRFIFFIILIFLPFTISSGRYKSLREYFNKIKTLELYHGTSQSSEATIEFSSPTPPLTTTTTTTTHISPTTSSHTLSIVLPSETSSITSKGRWFGRIIEILCTIFGSCTLVITFKFVRNGYQCKINWFLPKFSDYHQNDDNDENTTPPYAVINFSALNPLTSINSTQ